MEVRDSQTSKKGKENKQNPYRPDAALEKDPPKKEIDRKRIPFVWSEGGAALTEMARCGCRPRKREKWNSQE
jgi:hypothetical protein